MTTMLADHPSFCSNTMADNNDDEGFPEVLSEEKNSKSEEDKLHDSCSLQKFGEGLKNLNFGEQLHQSFSVTNDDVKAANTTTNLKPISTASARAAAAARTGPAGGGGTGTDVVDNCLEFLQGAAPKPPQGITESIGVADKLKAKVELSLADKLKVKVELSKVSLGPGKIAGGGATGEAIATTSSEPKENKNEKEEIVKEDEKKGQEENDNIDATSEGKRESSGKISRGRPRNVLSNTPGPRERDSSVGKKKVFTDLLADDGDDSDDSDVEDSSNKKKSSTPEGNDGGASGESKKTALENRRAPLSPRGRMGLERARSERSLSPRSKSPLNRTGSVESAATNLKSLPRPGLVSRAHTTGHSNAAHTTGHSHAADDQEEDTTSSPRRGVARTRSGEGLDHIPRRSRSPAPDGRPGLLAGPSGGRPGLLSRSPSRRGLMAKSQSVRNMGGGRSLSPVHRRSDSGMKIDQDDLKGALSGSNQNHNNDNKGEMTAKDRSLSRSASRRNLSKTRSNRRLKIDDDDDINKKDGLLDDDDDDDKPVPRSSTPSRMRRLRSGGTKETDDDKSPTRLKRTNSGGDVENNDDKPVARTSAPSRLRRTNSGGDVEADGDDKPLARASAPSRGLAAKKKTGLDAASEHSPTRRRKGNLVVEGDDLDDDEGEEKSKDTLDRSPSGATPPRRPRLLKTLSLKNLSRKKNFSKVDSDEENEKDEKSSDTKSSEPKLDGEDAKSLERKLDRKDSKSPEPKAERKDSKSSEQTEGKLNRKDSKSKDELGTSTEHRRRRHRSPRPEKSGEGRIRKTDETGAEGDDDAKGNDVDDEDGLGGSASRRPQRGGKGGAGRRRPNNQSGDEAEGDDCERHARRERRRRRPEEEGKKSPVRRTRSNLEDEEVEDKQSPVRRTRSNGDVDSGDRAEGKKSPVRRTRSNLDDEEVEDKQSPVRRTRSNGDVDSGDGRAADDRRQRKPRRRRPEEEKSDGELSPEPGHRHRSRTPGEDCERGDRHRGRRVRKGDAQNHSASPSRGQPTRQRKAGPRHQQDVTRNQYANMIKYAQERDEEEEEKQEEETQLEEEEPESEEVHEETDEQGKKKGGLFTSALGKVAKTAMQTTKLAVNTASQTTKIAVNTATEGVKLASNTLGVNHPYHGGRGSEDYESKKRMLQPNGSISDLAGSVLGDESSAAFARKTLIDELKEFNNNVQS